MTTILIIGGGGYVGTELQKVLIEKLIPILAEYSESNSISMILPKQNIIIGKSNLDLTKTVIDILNEKVKSIKLN